MGDEEFWARMAAKRAAVIRAGVEQCRQMEKGVKENGKEKESN